MSAPLDLSLPGRRALVTGAGAGGGRAIAERLAQAGCAVAVNDIDPTRAEATASALRALGHTAVAVPADVRVETAIESMIAATCAELGGLDIAVNNVGMLGGRHAAPFLELDGAAIRDIVEQNLIATALCCRAEAAAMVAAGGGSIVNVSSGESQRPAVDLAPYGAAKAGINHLTRTLAAELGRHRIRVNTAAPGTMLTERVRAALSPDYLEALRASIPLGRLTDPDDLARVVLFLVSDLAAHVTGQFLLVDGGADLSRNRPPRP
ncbi:MAG TPA: SDR family oxidoreductase [Candidatus Dormibacteraeota bacterium]|nr:SDR family oxidoreductase [Candidatus Dormibacteraeota bacterium]